MKYKKYTEDVIVKVPIQDNLEIGISALKFEDIIYTINDKRYRIFWTNTDTLIAIPADTVDKAYKEAVSESK